MDAITHYLSFPNFKTKTSATATDNEMKSNQHRIKEKSSLVNTLPKTKKDKHTAVTEAHIECTWAANALANSLQKAN